MKSTWELYQGEKQVDSVIAENVVRAKDEFEEKGYSGLVTIRKAGTTIQYHVILKQS